jgi:16S rRNA (uracil1498-N3)-methyltransferase
MHRVYAPNADSTAVAVTGDEAHHLSRVLRLTAGDDVFVFDGRGREWLGRLASVTGTRATIDLVEPRAAVGEPPVHVTLGIAMLKGDQMDAVVRDATMMGAAAIAPFVSAHVAVPERAWRSRSVDRWQRVAVASARQCRRAVVPEIRDVATFEALLAAPGADALVVCAEPSAAEAGSVPMLPEGSTAIVLVGPEGGWSAVEVERARRAGAEFVSLGPRTLRAESAPTVVLTALWLRWGWERAVVSRPR